MTNNKILYIVIAVLVLAVIGGGLFFFLGNKGAQKETGAGQQDNHFHRQPWRRRLEAETPA